MWRIPSEHIRKEYFTIEEIAVMLNESHSCINFWRKAFGIPAWHSKGLNHAWKFSRPMVAKFHVIKQLIRIEKFTIEGAKRKLHETK